MSIIRICSKCGSDKTYYEKRRQIYRWFYDKEGNTICKKCNQAIYYLDNHERLSNYHKVYTLEHYEQLLNCKKVWYAEHREQNINSSKVWQAEHPDYYKVRYLERRTEQ